MGLDGTVAATRDEGAPNLRIVPVGDIGWATTLVAGVEGPNSQGWWSASYNEKLPSTTAVYRVRHRGPALFAWLLAPHDPGETAPSIERLPAAAGTLRVRVHAAGDQEIAVRMRGSRPLSLSGGITIDGDLAILDNGRLLSGG